MKKLFYTLLFITIGLVCPAVVFSQTIAGTVFQDINFNGNKDAADPGVGGVIVRAYDDNDPISTPTSTATTVAAGTYTLTGLTAATKYRIEISNPNTWLFPGPNGTGSQTTVRIATTGATNVNFGLVLPTDYCQAVPDVIVPCFVSGNPLGNGTAGSEDALVKFGYNNSGTSGSMTHLASAKKIGTVWGIAYQRETKKVFSSAFLKRHSGIGPGGLGAIYISDVNTFEATSVYADLTTLGVTLAAPADLTYINSTRNGTLPAVATSSSQDAQVFPLIGKVGMGGMDLSTNGDTLWIVNLYEKKLIRILLGNPHKASLTAADVTQYSIPDPGCASGSWRPWAVRYDKGKIYVGGVCDAGTAGARSNLRAYVYTFNPVSNTFNGTPVIQYPLDYTKGATHTGDAAIGKNWEPWRDTWADMFKGGVLSAGTRTARPQPILSDIDFDESGNMVMTFTDRGGHQLGVGQQAIPSDGKAYNGYINGDMLIAKNNGNSTFTLESNGAITGKTGTGVGNGQGPGGGEFFANDLYPVSGSVIHQETVIGASLILPGKNEVMTISMDPLNVWTGGVNVANLTNGTNVRRYQIYATGPGQNGSQGKANGLGLTAPGCDAAPIEIGNVIWLDSDGDGVQDPGENGIVGVRVELRKSSDNSLVSFAITDGNGFYLFSNATGTSTGSAKYGLTGLTYFTGYRVVIPNITGGSKQSALGTNVLTQNDAGGIDALADLRDSDGTANVNDAQTPVFTTGSGAMNNHTFDFGFKPFVAPQPPAPCTLISGLSSNLATVCDDARSITFTITHDATLVPSQTMKLVYSTTALTAAQLYSGSGTTLSSAIAPVTGQTSKLVTASMPTNVGASPVSYFVYVVFETAPADPTCRPFGSVSPITVNPQVAPATFPSGTYFEICDRDNGANENVRNLNSLVSGNTSGAWTVSGSPTMSGTFTGGIFTAALADAGKTFTFTYTLTGTGPAGSACATKTYTVTIKVNACPCYQPMQTICGSETITASVPSGYTVTWYKENGVTDTQVGAPGDDQITISTTGEYYYTGTDANGCPVELCCRILVTQNTLPAVINTTQQTICNVNRPSTAAADNAIDLDNQFVSGNNGGTWALSPTSPAAAGTLGAGNVFTAAQADAGKTLIFRYTIVGTGGCPNLTYDVPVLINSCECPTFTGIVTPGPVCSDEKYSITLNHTEAPLGGNVEFYYSTVGGLVAADLYAPFHGGATLIGTTAIGTNGSTTLNNVQLPASGQSVTYYIYAIYVPSPAIAGCQPFFLPPATVTVQGPTVPATVSAPAPLCNVGFGNNDNVLNLMTLVTGNTGGTWSSANPTAQAAISSNVFTATAGMAGQTFTLIYTVPGASGSQTSACGDIVYTMDITIKDCSCPSVDILTTSGTPSTVCSNGTFSVTINHRSNPGNLQLYYIEDAGNDGTELTASQLYSGSGTALSGVISPAMNATTTTVSSLSLPVNNSGVAKNYIIYVRLATGNGNISANCQPISQKLIATLPQTPTATVNTVAEVCEASYSTNLNKINLNILITAGFTGGTWIDTDNSGGLSGSIFTASSAMAGTTYTFTYKIDGVGAGNCGDRTYDVEVTVKNCAVPCGTISSISPAAAAVCSDSPFSVTIQHTAGIGEMSIYWGESTAYGDYEFYTDGFDNADVHLLGHVMPASAGATSTTATGLTLPLYNGTSRDIYLYVVLRVGNSNRVIPFCIPYAYNTMQQDPALQASAGTDGSTSVCDNSTTSINLFGLITGETAGGTWTRETGTGGTFDANAGTFIPAPGATTSTFKYTIPGSLSCPGDEAIATVNISAYKTAGADGNTLVCDNSTTVINLFDLITGEAAGGVWTRTTGTGGTFNAAAGTFTPALGATTSTFTYTITGTAPCPNDEAIATVNISAYKTAGADGNTLVCDNSTTVINLFDLITGEAAGGVWTRTTGTGGTFNAAAGTFTPALGATTSTFTYTITGTAPCPGDEAIATVNISAYKTAGADGNTLVCDNSTTVINLFDLITGEAAGGVWTRTTGTGGTFNAAAGTFTPALGATTSTFTYTITGTAPCPNDEAIATVNISAYKTAGADGNTLVCDNSTTVINLFDLITGEAAGGVWTRTTGTGGTFNAAAGTFTPALGATTSTFTYTITGTAPCPNDEAIATVNISAYKTAGADGNTLVCDNSTTVINLFDLITGESAGGVWTRTTGTGGTFNAAAGTFTPALGATTSTFTYSITGIAPCPNETSVATVNISAYKTAGTDGSTSVCDNSLAVINLFSLIGGESTGGVWTRTSGTGGVFVALTGTFIPAPGATTSTFKYSITGTAPCPNDESIATVNISPYKWAGDAGSLSVCDNSTNAINLFDVIIDEASGGVWTRTGGTGGIFDANTGTFTPALGATTSTFVYTITNPSPCINSTSVAIIYVRPYKTAGTSGNTSICDNSTTAVNLFDLITGESTGGVWTRTTGTGGTFNAAAGTFTPASGATTSTFTYSITGTAPCPNEASVATVNISAYKTAGTGGNTSICDNSTTVINLFDLITGESTGGIWTRTTGTGGTFNAAAGTFTPALGATTSTFTYSITGTAPCPNETAVATINISAYKTAGADGSISVCDYSATTINLFSLITGEDAGGVWTRVSGTGGTFNAAAGIFTPALGATTSTFAYSFTGIAPCDGDFSIVTVNITPKPVAAIVPKTNVICANGVLPTFTATPASGVTYEWYGPLSDTTSNLGTALSSTVTSFTPTTAQINYIGIRYFAVIVKTTGASICSDTAFVQLKINPKPSVTPSALAVCENTPGSGLGTFNLSSLNTTVGGSNSVSWFSNKERTTSINAPAVYISATGKAYARVTILETGCSDTTSVSLTVQGKPVQINAETSCVATSNGSGKIVVTATAPAGGSLEYKLDIAGTYGSAATFNGVTNGNHTVYVRVVGSNCYDSTIVNINCFCTQPTLTVVDPAPVCSPMTVNITSSSVITTNTGVRTNYWKNAALTQPLDATTGPATAVKLSGTYYIKSMLSDSTCYTAKAVEVKINPLPVVKDTSLALCDLGNGKAVFNLLLAESAVKGLTNNMVSWYSNADRTVVIGTPSTYLSSSGKVYVRVTNPTTNCSDTTSVNLIIYAKPNAGVDMVGGTAICNTAATVDLPNAAQGESWSQLGNTPKVVTINANTGVVTGMDAIGTYRFILRNTITGCADTVSVETKNCLKGSIGDLVWKDLNDNGLQDLPTEKGVPNVIVQLLNANTGALLKTDTTDANGIYSFTGLEDGNYKVKIVLSSLPSDCQLSTRQDAGGVNDDAIDSDFGPTGESPVVVINTLGTGLAKDNPTIDAALIKTCVQPTWQVTLAPVCSPTSATYSVSFSVTNQIGVLKVNRGTLSGSNPYTVTGIPNGVNLVITDSLRASCKFQNTIVAPDCSCPQITLLTPNATACKGDTLPTLKIFLAGSNTNGVGANWYSASTGGILLGTGLNFKPSGTIATTMTFYIELTGTTGACLNQPRTPVTVTALDCNVDLALKKSISTKIAQIGDILTYTLKVWNESGSNASGVEVTDSIAVTSQFQSGSFVASRGSATISNSVIKWVIGSIVANGDTVTLSYQVKATQQGLHFNTAEISKINEKDVDSTPGNGKDDEDDIDRQCFTVPVKLCATEKIQASVPAKYLNVQWFKNGSNTPIASGNTVLLTGEGTYTFKATNNVCPAEGCCPIIIDPAANCCPEDLCVPFTIKQTKKAGKVVR